MRLVSRKLVRNRKRSLLRGCRENRQAAGATEQATRGNAAVALLQPFADEKTVPEPNYFPIDKRSGESTAAPPLTDFRGFRSLILAEPLFGGREALALFFFMR